MHKLDSAYMLREHKTSIDRMFSCDDGAIATQSGKRDMRPKGPFVDLSKREKQHGAQLRHRRRGRAFHPQEARTSPLRTVSDVPEFQGEIAAIIGDATERLDRIRYRSLVPRRHQGEMNVGGSDEPNPKSLQFLRHPGKFAGSHGRDLDGDKNPRRPRTAWACNQATGFVRSAFRCHEDARCSCGA